MNNYLKILDRYIIRTYLSSFGFVMLMLTVIACVIDLGEKIEDFKKDHVPFKVVFVDYYLNFIPHINALLFPLIALISVVFFTSRMAYNSEIISIFNAGVSFRRLMRPYLVGGAILACLHLMFNHFIVPNGNKKRLEVEHKHVWRNMDKGKTDNVHLFLDPKTAVFIGSYRKSDTTMRDFRIEKFDDNGLLSSVLKAETGTWKGAPNHWKFQTLQRRYFNGLTESLQTNTVELDTTIDILPDDFVRYTNQNEMLTTSELNYEIQKLQRRGVGNTKNYEIEVHRRTSEPFTILILTVIGMALAARKVRGGMGLHLALGIGIGAIFIFLSKFAVTFATQPGIPAWFGVWIPNFVFGGVAAHLISKAQK
jgi:lipopolysaccharide export system permease protein